MMFNYNLSKYNLIKEVFLISVLGVAINSSPISQTKSLAYTVNDSLICGQTINFSWTQKGNISEEEFIFSWNAKGSRATNLKVKQSPLTYTLNCEEPESTDVTDIVPELPLIPGSGNSNIMLGEGMIETDDIDTLSDRVLVKPPFKKINFSFTAPPNATDWKQTIKGKNGGSIVDAAGLISSNTNNNLFEFIPLSELPSIGWRIPDLAPFSGNDPNLTIYTAVNLSLYMEENPLGFNNGNWQVGQTLDEIGVEIINGEVSGLEGIYWSTMPFEFDLTSNTGFTTIGGETSLLNSSSFSQNIGVLQEHRQSIPENTSPLSFLTLLILGFPKLIKKQEHESAKPKVKTFC